MTFESSPHTTSRAVVCPCSLGYVDYVQVAQARPSSFEPHWIVDATEHVISKAEGRQSLCLQQVVYKKKKSPLLLLLWKSA